MLAPDGSIVKLAQSYSRSKTDKMPGRSFSRIRLCVVIYFENTTKTCNFNNQNQSKSRIVKQTKIPFQIFTFLLRFTTPTNRTNHVNVRRNHIQLPNTGPLSAATPTHK